MSNIGEYLKNTRMAKNFSIDEVAEATGIRAQYLEALEKSEYTKIPGDVFIKGFIRNYGNYLGLNGNDLVEQYKKRNQETAPSEPTVVVKRSSESQPYPPRYHESVTREAETQQAPEETHYQQPKEYRQEQSVQQEEPAGREYAGQQEQTEDQAEHPEKKKGFLGGAWGDLKAFVIDNIYETVEEDDDDENEPEPVKPFVPVKEQIPVNKSTNKSSFFSVKVFGIVFVICMVIFVGVMGYFMLAGTSSKKLNVDTGFNSTAKSAHSTDKAADKDAAKKADQDKKDEKKTDKKEETKTLGTGEGVTVEISVLKPCWTQVTADGKTLEAATLQPGATRVYKGSNSVKVNVGSIRYVKIKVNGKEVPVTDKEWGEATKVFTK